MDQFINFLQQWLPSLQLITAVVGTLAAFLQRKRLLMVFVLFFWYAILHEFWAEYYGTHINVGNNSLIYNIFYPIFFGVLFYLLHESVASRLAKRGIRLMYGIYLGSIIVEVFWLKVDYTMLRQAIPYILGGTFILVAILYFFAELLRSESVIRVEQNPVFWIATAYFFYLLAYVPLKVGQNYYANSESTAGLLNIYFVMTLITNLILIIGFIWSSRKVLK